MALLAIGARSALAQGDMTTQATADPFAGPGLPGIAVTNTDDAFEGVPEELTAGRYVLSVMNAFDRSDEETSGAAFLQLPRGMSATGFLAEINAAEAAPESTSASVEEENGASPPWYYETALAGGAYAALGETAYAVIDLTAGEWILWGEALGAPQAPVSVTVTGEPPPDPPTPSAAVTVTLSEFAFDFSTPLAAGPQIIEVVNTGDQPHFIFIGGVPDGTTVEEAQAAFTAYWDPTASEAGEFSFAETSELLGTGDQSAGATVWYAVDLPKSTVVVACFVTDPESGLPHAMRGMTRIMVIE